MHVGGGHLPRHPTYFTLPTEGTGVLSQEASEQSLALVGGSLVAQLAHVCMCTCVQLGGSGGCGSAPHRPVFFLCSLPLCICCASWAILFFMVQPPFPGQSRGILQADTHCRSKLQVVLVAFVLAGVELREGEKPCQ